MVCSRLSGITHTSCAHNLLIVRSGQTKKSDKLIKKVIVGSSPSDLDKPGAIRRSVCMKSNRCGFRASEPRGDSTKSIVLNGCTGGSIKGISRRRYPGRFPHGVLG